MQYKDERLSPSRFAIIRWFGFDQFEPERAVTSYWVSPSMLCLIRVPITLYSTIVIWTNIGYTTTQGGMKDFFGYFTNLTYIGLHAYLVTALFHSICYLRTPERYPRSFFIQPTVINYLYVYLYHTVLVFNIITPVVYWSMLNNGRAGINPMDAWLNVSVHGVSFFLMMFEMIFSRMQMYMNMVLLIVINVILYMFLSWIVHATAGWWVYPFLDWDNGPVAAGYYIGVGAAFVVVFFLQMLFHWIRVTIARCTGCAPRKREMVELEQHNKEEV
ncbi:hypothetical protein LRAMOSA01972 [Lichtheimia ramosa]|uniref:Uncharacterized protein n=1 Tax=Lichtheimia ramosa TaxID=688394 RepID=A0A077WLK2_9FUNG|nr:hypothetical protein LRAMOSA01972 [Lichtheimia ramosa]